MSNNRNKKIFIGILYLVFVVLCFRTFIAQLNVGDIIYAYITLFSLLVYGLFAGAALYYSIIENQVLMYKWGSLAFLFYNVLLRLIRDIYLKNIISYFVYSVLVLLSVSIIKISFSVKENDVKENKYTNLLRRLSVIALLIGILLTGWERAS